MITPEQALELARLYASAKSIAVGTVARHALGTNHKVFGRIEAGHGANARTLQLLETWFRANWPENAPWPPGIQPGPRPRRTRTPPTEAANGAKP